MMRTTLLGLCALTMGGMLYAQEPLSPEMLKETALLDGKTIVKLNATGLLTRNFGFTAERVLTRRLSFQLGYNVMPERRIPITGLLGLNDPVIEASRITHQTFTPELRIYISRGYGQGFYVSPYYRYERLGLNRVPIDLLATEEVKSINLSGSYKANSFGVAFGYQRFFGAKKNFVVDATLGAHFGQGKLYISGEEARGLSVANLKHLNETLSKTVNTLPFTAKDEVNTPTKEDVQKAMMAGKPITQVSKSFRSSWGFYRASISVGYRF